MEHVAVEACDRVVHERLNRDAKILQLLAYRREIGLQDRPEGTHLKPEVALAISEHGRVLKAEEPRILPHHRNYDQECIFECHDVDDAVDELEEASGVAELVFLALVLERLAPDNKDAHQLPHLLLVLLHLVLSTQLELFLVIASCRQWLLELAVIGACLFIVAGWEPEVQNILVNLPERSAVVF